MLSTRFPRDVPRRYRQRAKARRWGSDDNRGGRKPARYATGGAGWFVLAVWAALGTFLAVLRGAALAIGVGVVVYALVSEGLIDTYAAGSSGPLGAVSKDILRSNAYSFVAPFGGSTTIVGDGRPSAVSASSLVAPALAPWSWRPAGRSSSWRRRSSSYGATWLERGGAKFGVRWLRRR